MPEVGDDEGDARDQREKVAEGGGDRMGGQDPGERVGLAVSAGRRVSATRVEGREEGTGLFLPAGSPAACKKSADQVRREWKRR